MILFDDISVGYTSVLNKLYPRITAEDAVVPTTTGQITTMTLEKYTIPREDLAGLSLYYTNGAKIIINYDENRIYASLILSNLNVSLLGTKIGYDLITRWEARTTSFIDSDADLENYMYIYRIACVTPSWSHNSSYTLAGLIPTSTSYEEELAALIGPILDRNGSIYREGKEAGTLYMPTDSGIMVEKGLAMVHASPRYRGPIELSKERARRTSIMGVQEYIEALTEEIESAISDVTGDLSLLGEALVMNLTQNSGD